MKSKETKRKECEARNEKWRALTPQQQLDLVYQRPGKSARQRARIEALIPKPEPIAMTIKPVPQPQGKPVIKTGSRVVLIPDHRRRG